MNFIIELLFDLAGELIQHLIPTSKSKMEKHIERLKGESWFRELESDYRYSYIIHSNKKVKRFLKSEKNIKMVISVEEEREKFINLIKDEHVKFTRLH